MKPSEILSRAIALLADKSSWTKGNYSKTRKPGEYCFCMLGSCLSYNTPFSAGHINRHKACDFLVAATPKRYKDAVSFNDAKSTKHHHVLAVMAKALRLALDAEAKEAK